MSFGLAAVVVLIDQPAAGAAGLVVGLVGWWYSAVRALRSRSGAIGEREVARQLGRSAVTIHNWRPPGRRGDVDVVVGAPVLAAIEVKRASGRVRCGADGTTFVGGRALPGTPLRQAVGGAAAVRNAVDGGHVEAILCVTGMTNRPKVVSIGTSHVTVCSARHLRRVLRRLSHGDSRRGRTEGRAVLRRLVEDE
jgi:hypothetical protein